MLVINKNQKNLKIYDAILDYIHSPVIFFIIMIVVEEYNF